MIVECPHVGIRELSEAWGVSARTVKEWLASAGIKTVVRGRYRISDVTRYADQYGKPKLSNRERLEVMQVQKALDNANAEIAELQECLLKVSGVTADAVQKIVRQMKKETEIVEMRQSR